MYGAPAYFKTAAFQVLLLVVVETENSCIEWSLQNTFLNVQTPTRLDLEVRREGWNL